MNSLRWKFNRIRAMESGEVPFRITRKFQVGVERKKILQGWQPIPNESVKSDKPLFNQDIHAIIKQWREEFGEIDLEPYFSSLNNISLFAHSDIDISSEVDWHTDPDTGVKSPLIFGKDIDYRDNDQVGNCKTIWELSRHKHLVPLSAAYALSGDERYLQKVIQHIEGWINQNPYGLGVNWCSSLEVSLRVISWGFSHSLIRLRCPDGIFGEVSDAELFGRSLYQHCYFIFNYLSRFSSANNHLIGELAGLWITCNIFNLGEEGRTWSNFAKSELEAEAVKQVYEDGVSKEQATYYHLWVNEYLLVCCLIGERFDNPFSKSVTDRLVKMSQFLIDIRPDDGQVPQIGDSDDGRVLVFDPTNTVNAYDDFISAASSLFSEDNKLKKPGLAKAFWYSQVVSPSQALRISTLKLNSNNKLLTTYNHGGYSIIKDRSMHVVFDAGSLGYPSIAAHGHADALSFCLSLDGEWWIVDPGTYCYHTEPDWRDYFRGTGAHNTICIENMDQSLIGGAFMWLKHADIKFDEAAMDESGSVTLCGEVEGYGKNNPQHRRTFKYEPDQKTITIKDVLSSRISVDYEIRFHFHPDVQLNFKDDDTLIVSRKTSDKTFTLLLDSSLDWRLASGEENPHLGWYSDDLGIKVPCGVLAGAASTEDVNSLTTVISL